MCCNRSEYTQLIHIIRIYFTTFTYNMVQAQKAVKGNFMIDYCSRNSKEKICWQRHFFSTLVFRKPTPSFLCNPTIFASTPCIAKFFNRKFCMKQLHKFLVITKISFGATLSQLSPIQNSREYLKNELNHAEIVFMSPIKT